MAGSNPQLEPRTVKTLPDHYQEVFFLRVTDRRKILWLNLAAIGLILVSSVMFVGWLVLYHVAGAPLVITRLPDEIPTLPGLLITLSILPLHEWVHGLAIGWYGHPARYGIKPLQGVLYATSDGALFWRDQYIGVALAPLIVISLVAILLSLFLPAGIALWFMFAAALNATGAVGDLWMWWAVRRFPPHALVRDEADGMRVFAPESL